LADPIDQRLSFDEQKRFIGKFGEPGKFKRPILGNAPQHDLCRLDREIAFLHPIKGKSREHESHYRKHAIRLEGFFIRFSWQ